jgi:uncharacterized protein (DUF488 family)
VTVYTLGHSTRSAAEFMTLLREHGIAGISDVRRFPASRRHPHFGREALAEMLAAAGLHYDWLPALGGRRAPRPDSPHTAWREPAFRAYADHMETEEFRAGLEQLIRLVEARPTAVMCAEAVPWRCHRSLVADALVAHGDEVVDIMGPGKGKPHALTPWARVENAHVSYPGAGPAAEV